MQESPIFSRTYDMILWLLPQVTQFPRTHRFGLGERVTRQALEFQESIVAAGLVKTGKIEMLSKADIILAQLRLNLRLCKDLDLLAVNQYEHVSAMLTEIGRLLGGWQRSLK
ncbi:MAG: diversity-generating retroelement protein Avd [Chloroflexota bacterium]